MVGALDLANGKNYDWSLSGDYVTVIAPGHVTCDLNKPGDSTVEREGTSQSAALVSGLASYLLSLEDLGPKLRAAKSIPLAVRNWIGDKAYIRGDGTIDDKAVWNGLKILPGSATNFRWYPDLGVNP